MRLNSTCPQRALSTYRIIKGLGFKVSLKELIVGSIMGVTKGDTRSLDYSLYMGANPDHMT